MVNRRPPARAHVTDLSQLHREIQVLFARLEEYEHAERQSAGEWSPNVDVYECRGRLVVVVEVPGLKPESLRVVLRDRQLVVSGERPQTKPPRGVAGFLCVERSSGRFARTIPLDLAVDVREADATLASGLLTITMPRLADRRGREIQIPVRREGQQ